MEEDKEKFLRTKLKDYEIYTWMLIILSSYFFVGAIIKFFQDEYHAATTIVYIILLFLIIVSYLIYEIQQIYIKLEKDEQN